MSKLYRTIIQQVPYNNNKRVLMRFFLLLVVVATIAVQAQGPLAAFRRSLKLEVVRKTLHIDWLQLHRLAAALAVFTLNVPY
jgi:hypothetical protein